MTTHSADVAFLTSNAKNVLNWNKEQPTKITDVTICEAKCVLSTKRSTEQSDLMIETKIKLRIEKADLSSQTESRVFIRIHKPQLFTVHHLCESLTSLCDHPPSWPGSRCHSHLHRNTMTFLKSSWMFLRGCQRKYVCFWALNSTYSAHQFTYSSFYHFCVLQMLFLTTLQDRKSWEYKRIKNYK